MKLTKQEQKTYWVCPGCEWRTRSLLRFDLHLREHGSVFREKHWEELVPRKAGPAQKKK